MRTIFSFFLFFSFLSGATAQGKLNLVIFSEDGDPFYAIINGIKQNSNPETNVKITDLNANSVNVKIIFVDAAIPPVSKNMMLEFANEYTVKLKRDKKGNMVLRMFGQVPVEQSTSSAPAVVYHTTETPVTPVTTNTTVTGTNGTGTTVVERTETTTTTTTTGGTGTTVTTGTTGTTANENVSLNMSVNGVGVNMNVNVDGTGTGTGTSTTVTGTDVNSGTVANGTTTTQMTTTTTTTTTTSGNTSLLNVSGESNGSTTTTSGTTTPVNTSSNGCYYPVSDSEFSEFKTSVSSKTFSESKMQIAQQITKNNCLSSAQIKEIMKTFDFEADKLEYAKFAYQYAYDKNNYYKVNDAFDFESSIDELNEFINK